MQVFYKVEISAESKAQAYDILDPLLQKKLVTGGQIVAAPARFLWKGNIQDMDYRMIMSFTTEKHKAAIIAEVKEISIEEVPMITFLPMEGNPELLKWIEETVA